MNDEQRFNHSELTPELNAVRDFLSQCIPFELLTHPSQL